MPAPVRLVLVFHNHQPVGNFDSVVEQAYQDSYRPFLDVFEPFKNLQIALHTSGPLMEWLETHHPEYIDRLARLVSSGRIEIVGGAFYEPILTMISPEDRRGQIRTYTEWLEDHFNTRIRGMWVPERVWEQSLVTDIRAAGIYYTLLDDFHFKSAGLTEDLLHGYYITEDNGRLLSIFPGSERLRYTIPFADPETTIHYLKDVGEHHPGAVVAFGDDGEKFGVWPDTNKHVYSDGWLARFFGALTENGEWLEVTTPSKILDSVPPVAKIYLPEGSYREMTEWALPASRIEEFEQIRHEFDLDNQWHRIAPFVRGGYWRNFKVKYPETNEMYSRMQMVSRRVRDSVASPEAVNMARRELYRGQCNCGYWHGAFGGAYLPHLRNAIYNHLIAADNILDEAANRGLGEMATPWVEAVADDYDFDARQEIRLASNRLIALLAPACGGVLYELDVRAICLNVLATLARRHEGYHHLVLSGPTDNGQAVASIHHLVHFKQEGLDQRVQYDAYPRKSLIDHFFDTRVRADAVAAGNAAELGDFVRSPYDAKILRSSDRVQVQLTRQGFVDGHSVRLSKSVTLTANQSFFELTYLLEGLPQEKPLHLAVEMNFAGMPSGQDDRYFRDAAGNHLGQLGALLDLENTFSLNLVDHWQGLDVGLHMDRPTGFWTFPIETVSRSEGGFELVHQSTVVMPHWTVLADGHGQWRVTFQVGLDASLAESRILQESVAAV
ncbi:MAG: DUF1926 domain-containing protein [Pirellulales bacterium]|nr:DUF1926 domain-containing protein [Pirellulales bacterium]